MYVLYLLLFNYCFYNNTHVPNTNPRSNNIFWSVPEFTVTCINFLDCDFFTPYHRRHLNGNHKETKDLLSVLLNPWYAFTCSYVLYFWKDYLSFPTSSSFLDSSSNTRPFSHACITLHLLPFLPSSFSRRVHCSDLQADPLSSSHILLRFIPLIHCPISSFSFI